MTEQATGQAIEGVNVTVKDLKNNKVLSQAVSSAKGAYLVTAIPPGPYYLSASFVGYTALNSSPFTIDEAHDKIFLNLGLTAAPQALREVAITSKKQIYDNSLDRKVYNVQQDVMSKSGSAGEVLQNVPLVQVDAAKHPVK